MRFTPTKENFKKIFKYGKYKLSKFNTLVEHCYGVQSLCFGLLTGKQVESLRRFISRNIMKRGKILRRIHMTQTLTKKAMESRMGRGVGAFFIWVAYIYPGSVLFEFSKVEISVRKKVRFVFKNIGTKVPFSCRFVLLNIFYDHLKRFS